MNIQNNFNEGNYKFYFTPCLEGCEFNVGSNEYIYRNKTSSNNEINVNGIIQKDVMLKFIQESINQIINHIRK